MVKKSLLVILLLVFMMISFSSCMFSTDDLIFLDEGGAVKSVDIYRDIDAIVAENGNCYIRGLITDSFLYGVENTEQYLNLYKTLDISKSTKFTQIYSGGDAESIRLSNNGGVIITEDSDLFLFADIEGYETPVLFCGDVQSALLVEERIYILTPDGTLGYRDVKTPDTFVSVADHIRKFEIGGNNNCFWLLSDTNVLSVYTNEACTDALWQIEDVSDFDVYCEYADPGETDFKCVLAYTAKGACYNYTGYGVENAEKFANKLVSEGAVSAAAYHSGVIVLNEDKDVLIFGKGLYSNDTFNGEVIANGGSKLCGDFSDLAIITEKGVLITAGSLPDSSSVTIADLIEAAS